MASNLAAAGAFCHVWIPATGIHHTRTAARISLSRESGALVLRHVKQAWSQVKGATGMAQVGKTAGGLAKEGQGLLRGQEERNGHIGVQHSSLST